MLWCLIILAGLVAIAGLLVLHAGPSRLPTLRIPRLHPGKIARGCLAILCLLGALLFLIVAIIIELLGS